MHPTPQFITLQCKQINSCKCYWKKESMLATQGTVLRTEVFRICLIQHSDTVGWMTWSVSDLYANKQEWQPAASGKQPSITVVQVVRCHSKRHILTTGTNIALCSLVTVFMLLNQQNILDSVNKKINNSCLKLFFVENCHIHCDIVQTDVNSNMCN